MAENTNEPITIHTEGVQIRLLRNDRDAFVPLTTPDAIVFTRKDKEDNDEIVYLTQKLEELDNMDTYITDEIIDGENGIIENISQIRSDINDINSNIDNIEKDITGLENNKANKIDVEKQVTRLDGEITRIDDEIGTINKEIKELNGDITRVDSEIETIKADFGQIYIPENQYPVGEYPSEMREQKVLEDLLKDNPHAVYNKHYVDNHMLNRKQTETFIADTIKSQTYTKSEIDLRLGERVLIHDHEKESLQLYGEYKDQYVDLSSKSVTDILTINYPEISGDITPPEMQDIKYSFFTKISLYIKTGASVPKIVVDNGKTITLEPNSITEFTFTYIVGNWLISKTIFNG